MSRIFQGTRGILAQEEQRWWLSYAPRTGLAGIADFNQRLSLFQQFESRGQCALQDLSEPSVRGVAAGNPQNLRWGTKPRNQRKKVAVLCYEYRPGFPCRLEDLPVVGMEEPQPRGFQ